MGAQKGQSVVGTAAERRLTELLERAEKRRHEIAVALDSSQEALAKAREFTRSYEGISGERSEAQSFWNDFLQVFSIRRRDVGAEFEYGARRADTGNIGGVDFFWPGVMLVEHKSRGKDFADALEQADRYEIPGDLRPRLTVVCDFARLFVRDNHTGRSTEFDLKELPNHLGWFGPLVHDELTELAPQRPVDVHAAETMSDLHDALRASGYSGHQLRVLMTRLLFCFFADDAQIWPHGQFDRYLRGAPAAYAGPALSQLFYVLNTEPSKREAMLGPSVAIFPYVNGGLFEERLPIPSLSQELLDVLIPASEDIDWSAVSPAVFGAMFQGVMDSVERRDLGAHYTSEQNILRVIEPLFLDDLYRRIDEAGSVPQLEALWNEMAAMRFLDPAAGCGNFLVVAYRELRRAERHLMQRLKVLAQDDDRYMKRHPWVSGQRYIDSAVATRLSVSQFYGIEIDEWPARIAQVAMWLTDHLANMELEEQFGGHQTRLPLIDTAHIVIGNALRIDWEEVLGGDRANYVFGNPPFVGRRLRSDEQHADMSMIWKGLRGAGDLDYVACWFKVAAEYINGSDSRVAFVSTNSLSQGEQPAVLWKVLTGLDMHIDFAHRPFNWTNEASGQAAVHVVITGFSQGKKEAHKPLWVYPSQRGSGELRTTPSINPYLLPGEMVIVGSRRAPLAAEMPVATYGSMPIENGHLVVSAQEALELQTSDSVAASLLRRYVGTRELLYDEPRYCLWLDGADPSDLRKSQFIRKRVADVQAFRQGSSRAATRALANTPTLFGERRQPNSNYLAIPKVSSQRREYLPITILTANVISSGSLILVANGNQLVAFGILSSRLMSVWNATVSGRMKSDYQFSIEITYNNFPWLDVDATHRAAIEGASRKVLEVRQAFPTSTLADLYDPLSMPPALARAHLDLDRAALRGYGLKQSLSDEELLAALFKRHSELTGAASSG